MQINYTLYPSFVRAHFASTRVLLEGKKAPEIVVFQASLVTPPPVVVQPAQLEKRPVLVPRVRPPLIKNQFTPHAIVLRQPQKPVLAKSRLAKAVPEPTPVQPGIQAGLTQLGSRSTAKSPLEIQASRFNPASYLKGLKLPEVSIKVTLPSLPHILSKRGVQVALTGIIAVSVVVLAVVVTPELYYQIFPAEVVPVEATEDGTPLGGAFDQPQAVPTPTPKPLPPQDPTLPEGTWLVIPRIGVRTQPLATEDSEEALQKGVWQVPGYGEPGDTRMPLILAAHRYGWQWWWKTDYWKYHSFYALPELQPGDIVEVIHDQRKFYYEVYAGEEGDEISDYSADMILYTCKFLNSPIRHFRYARLIDMTKDSQGTRVSLQ